MGRDLKLTNEKTTPSDVIKLHIRARGITQMEFAREMGFSKSTLYRLLNNERDIDETDAALLSKIIGETPEYWLNLNKEYNFRKEEKNNG